MRKYCGVLDSYATYRCETSRQSQLLLYDDTDKKSRGLASWIKSSMGSRYQDRFLPRVIKDDMLNASFASASFTAI